MTDQTARDEEERLRAALAAALQRAELAESSMNLAHEDLIDLTERYDALLAELAAARRERDALKEALEGALRLCGRCNGKGRQWASATFDEAGKMTKGYKPCPDCTLFRAALEKANG